MMKYIYGPIPSRRLGKSLGISPIVKKTCNLSCVYCQLGLTDKMTNKETYDIGLDDIIKELADVLHQDIAIDVISIVGEGEPTLYRELGSLIEKIKSLTDIPVAVITNGTRLSNKETFNALLKADFVLPSLDAYDEESFKKINRPHKDITYADYLDALIDFSHTFPGELWLEIMICEGYNDSDEAVEKFLEILKTIKYSRLYINSPVRPPAIPSVKPLNHERLEFISKRLGGLNIDVLADPKFFSHQKDDYEAIISIISRHPMNKFEIESFLDSRQNRNKEAIFERLYADNNLEIINYKNFDTFRLR